MSLHNSLMSRHKFKGAQKKKCRNILSLCRDIINFGLNLKRQVYVATQSFNVVTQTQMMH